ncbi:MAG: ABC transporter ATP-binding protein [Chloroflexi bacterium]|nr:ABC transporter ATP-binding protein [Chloroflexota bacterium]MCH7654622.1 ABC transporter ATP-binding protein [Chloroflexota bacterium]
MGELPIRDEGAREGIIVDVRGVAKRFPVGDGEVTVLRDISFQVKQGEFVTIVGPSGSGKSTLLNLITGIDRPSEGEVEVAESRIDTMTEGELAKWRGRNLGLVFQFFQLLPALSLVDNVMLPMIFADKYSRRERRERALHLLEIVGLADQAQKLPSMVSGGEQQRSAIARAMANDPPLLVADEPTGNLDSAATLRMFELFLRLVQEGKTMVMVTHNQELASRAPRVLRLEDGRIDGDSGSRS